MILFFTSYNGKSYITIESDNKKKAIDFMNEHYNNKWYQYLTPDQKEIYGSQYTHQANHHIIK